MLGFPKDEIKRKTFHILTLIYVAAYWFLPKNVVLIGLAIAIIIVLIGEFIRAKNEAFNIFITLSPYFFPIYPIIIILIYFVLGWFMDITKIYSWFLFFSGMSLAFYYALTFYAIKVGQEDMKIYGKFFSLVFVCFINIIMVVFVLAWIFPNHIFVKDFFVNVISDGIDFYKYIFMGVYKCLAFLRTK